MASLDLGKPADNAVPFLISRAVAIQCYAMVESSLCTVFTALMNADMNAAAIVFYQITNTSSRNRIIQDLMGARYGETYDAFFHGVPGTKENKGLWNLVNGLDQSRNQIVHWHPVTNIHVTEETQTSTIELGKPNFFANSLARITAEDMQAFSKKADFVSRSLNMFHLMLLTDHVKDEAIRQPWRDICSRPCTYPPVQNHPLADQPKAPETPPQPSEA